MAERRLTSESPRTRFSGPAGFFLPDGTYMVAQCEARFTRERWQGSLELPRQPEEERHVERGDVCRLVAGPFGELRIVILDRIGTRRYEFIGLVKPDPFEPL